MTKSPETRYTDTHLSLAAFFDLRPLAVELARIGEVECTASAWNDGEWSIFVEPRELAAEPEQMFAAMLDVIEGVNASARRLWDSCYGRVFEFGYTSGAKPWTVRPVLSHALLTRIVSAGVNLEFSLHDAPTRKRKRRHQNEVHYLNTDLDVRSYKDLTRLALFFDQRGWSRMCLREGGNGEWYASYEVGNQQYEPELTMLRFLDVIEELDANGQESWDSCHLRVMDAGFDCGDFAPRSGYELSHRLLKRVAAMGMSLAFTMYARERSPSKASDYAAHARFVATETDKCSSESQSFL